MNELLLQGLSELGLDVSRAETLERFSSLLLEKNQVMNLTAITEPDAVAQLHLLDSAALTRFVDLSGKTVVDVGCSTRSASASTGCKRSVTSCN